MAYLNFADSLRGSGDDAAAETLLRKACALYPDSADAHFALGMLLVRRQEIAAGVSELGRANALAPNNSQYAYAYAVGLHSTRQDERALAALSDARARFPDNAPIAAALRALCADRAARRAIAAARDDERTIWTMRGSVTALRKTGTRCSTFLLVVLAWPWPSRL